MEKKSYQVSVIIVNYNTRQMTQECIDSVFEKTKDVTFEVILVDNNSKDGSKEHFENETRIKYVYSFENMGFGRANNVGLLLSKGEYVFLLNSDTILTNNAIKYFYDYAKEYDKENSLNFYGAWLLNKDKEIGLSFSKEPTIRSMLYKELTPYLAALKIIKCGEQAHRDHPYYGKTCEVGYISGADLFLNRRIVEQYGAFDHNFFMFFEEAEWQKRLKKYGIKSIVIEGPSIIHFHGGSDPKRKKESKYDSINSLLLMKQSRKYFLKKYYNAISRFYFEFVFFVLNTPFILLTPRYSFNDKIRYILSK